MSISKLLALGALCLAGAMADRQCTSNDHSVGTLPYWTAGQAQPCMYAGTFEVSATQQKNNLFYWLFKNTTLGDSTPLVLWLNGGPGASSMFGLFLENGPLRVSKTGPGMDAFKLGLAPGGSWADQADVLYVDQPAGTGFSYYQTSPLTSEADGAKEMLQMLQGFLAMYPEYNKRQFIIAGESYAGKYVPMLGKLVLDYNEQQQMLPPAQ